MFPVRCFTCNKVVGRYELRYQRLLTEGKTPQKALDEIGMSRYCCRRMFLGHVDLTEQLLMMPSKVDSVYEKKSVVQNIN